MTTETTCNLAREVAEALVSIGKLKRETMQEGYYNDLIDHGILVNFSRDIWITILDGDEVLSEMHPDYPNDLNACARDLTREGWRFSIKQWIEVGKPDTWLAEYYNNQLARGVGHWGDTPAVAWCESFLALTAYIRQLEVQLAKGEQS